MIVSENQAKLQFTLQKVAIAWGFCLVVTSVNRVAIADLGLPAMLVSFIIGVYTLFGPLQPVIGRICERYPIFGYRRTPYLLLGTLLGGMAFPFMPGVMVEMQSGSPLATLKLMFLFCCFGLCIAMQANTFLDLLKDTTSEEARSRITTLTWTIQALAMAFWAWVFALLMRDYSLQEMQALYNLSPLIMVGITFLGAYRLETPLTREQVAAIKDNPPPPVSVMEPMRESMGVLSYNRHARLFFIFIIFSLMSVFLQDLLQEIWAKDLFSMNAGDATVFQRLYNGFNTVGMGIMGIYVGISAKKRRAKLKEGEDPGPTLPFAKGKKLLLLGVSLSCLSFLLLAWASFEQNLTMFYAFYVVSATALGLYVFPSVSFMADMTVRHQESRYLGVWSLAQIIGLFLSFTVAGTIYTALVESGLLSSNTGFAVIFGLQALVVVLSYIAVKSVTVEGLNAGARDIDNLRDTANAQTT
ncbi:MAG: PucC family protein [Pseudomonadota bacterium]